MLEVVVNNRCRKEIKLMQKRGKDIGKLWDVVDRLREVQPLDRRHRPHRLSGDWNHCWECHIEPDWLLVYYSSDKNLYLVSTGTHADLFE